MSKPRHDGSGGVAILALKPRANDEPALYNERLSVQV